MKIRIKDFKKTRAFNIMHGILILTRIVVVIIFCMIPSLLSLGLFTALGVKNVVPKHIKFWTSIAIYGDDEV